MLLKTALALSYPVGVVEVRMIGKCGYSFKQALMSGTAASVSQQIRHESKYSGLSFFQKIRNVPAAVQYKQES